MTRRTQYLRYGGTWSTPGEVRGAVTGMGDTPVLITQWHLSRVTAAIVFGAASGGLGRLVAGYGSAYPATSSPSATVIPPA